MDCDLNMAVVGLGGVGNIVADAVFPFTRGPVLGWNLRTLLFVDGDTYTKGNIPRQKAAGRMLGYNKADAWRDIYERSKWNYMGTRFLSSREWLTKNNVARILSPVIRPEAFCVVFACVDNFPARVAMSKYMATLKDGDVSAVVIQGGCAKNYATSDLFGYWWSGDDFAFREVGRPIEKDHPEVLEDEEGDRSRMSCEELANSSSGDQTYVENFMAASMMMNLLFTLLTPKGGKVLSKHIGEVMEVTSHYHNIDKELPGDSPERSENESETCACNEGGPGAGPEAVPVLEKADGDPR